MIGVDSINDTISRFMSIYLFIPIFYIVFCFQYTLNGKWVGCFIIGDKTYVLSEPPLNHLLVTILYKSFEQFFVYLPRWYDSYSFDSTKKSFGCRHFVPGIIPQSYRSTNVRLGVLSWTGYLYYFIKDQIPRRRNLSRFLGTYKMVSSFFFLLFVSFYVCFLSSFVSSFFFVMFYFFYFCKLLEKTYFFLAKNFGFILF